MSNKITEEIAYRLTAQLSKLERAWEGMAIGIGFDIDEPSGKASIEFGPEDRPELVVKIVCDVRSVFVGAGETN